MSGNTLRAIRRRHRDRFSIASIARDFQIPVLLVRAALGQRPWPIEIEEKLPPKPSIGEREKQRLKRAMKEALKTPSPTERRRQVNCLIANYGDLITEWK